MKTLAGGGLTVTRRLRIEVERLQESLRQAERDRERFATRVAEERARAEAQKKLEREFCDWAGIQAIRWGLARGKIALSGEAAQVPVGWERRLSWLWPVRRTSMSALSATAACPTNCTPRHPVWLSKAPSASSVWKTCDASWLRALA